MSRVWYICTTLFILFAGFAACKKITPQPTNFTQITTTDGECRITGTPDTTQWNNDVLGYKLDTALLTFGTSVTTADSVTGKTTVSPICPNPGNGFFVWHVDVERECKLKLVCINESYQILYYNVYRLNGGPVEIGFDFRDNTAFKNDSSYRIFYGFYNSFDSLFYAGHGNFTVVKQ
jgi:hypothetical protein